MQHCEKPRKIPPVRSRDAFKKWSECGTNARLVNELKPPVFSQSERKIVALDLPASAPGVRGFFRFKVTSPSTSGKERFRSEHTSTPLPLLDGPQVYDMCVDMDLSAKPAVLRTKQVFTPAC